MMNLKETRKARLESWANRGHGTEHMLDYHISSREKIMEKKSDDEKQE